MNRSFATRFYFFFLAIMLLLSACQFPSGDDEPVFPSATPELRGAPSTPEPTEEPFRTLTVCIGGEPNTLYLYGNPNAPAQSVLQAIYDGPMDVINYEYRSVILQSIPSIENGQAELAQISVRGGQKIVDSNGQVVTLTTGTRVRTAGCRSDDCAITYDGTSTLQMDQLVVNFSILPLLVWSDGEPLTSADSVFSFQLAAHKDTPGSKYLIERTQTYEATDENSVQWWGLPGFIDPTYYTNFWMPLPQHAWGEFSAAELPEIDVASRAPIGWGPYIMTEWVTGDYLRLVKNIRYFRAEDDLPAFDELIFRIVPDPNAAISDLVAGRCDVLDASIPLDGQLSLLLQMQADNQVQLFTAPAKTIEWLGLGVVPGSYDDGYSTSPPLDRPDIFRDSRTRQAITMCLDRQQVVDTVLFGLADVPNTYLPPSHPLYNSAAPPYPYDPEQAANILDQIGWKDFDDDPSTPRQAQGVVNVPPLTPLEVTYYTTTASQRRQASEILIQNLRNCGIGVNAIYQNYVDFYAEGPVGPLFGRNFDLAQYAMGSTGFEPPCSWYHSGHIPNAENNWVGANVTGYSSQAYDTACSNAMSALPGEASYRENYLQTQAIFATDLPAIPLYTRLRIAAGRPDLCNFQLDHTANPLVSLEFIDYGLSCNP
ncbi:MAG: hypothetical protein Kow002_13530 [Anaerolineales bacterium]